RFKHRDRIAASNAQPHLQICGDPIAVLVIAAHVTIHASAHHRRRTNQKAILILKKGIDDSSVVKGPFAPYVLWQHDASVLAAFCIHEYVRTEDGSHVRM